MILTMKPINSFFIIVLLALLPLSSAAQSAYMKKANSAIAAGNYQEALTQLNAEKAYLRSRKVDQNSKEFMDVEKLIAKLESCASLVKSASSIMKKYSWEAFDDEYVNYVSAGIFNAGQLENIPTMADNYVAQLQIAKRKLQQVVMKCPSDKKTKSKIRTIEKTVSDISYAVSNREEFDAWKEAVFFGSYYYYTDFLKKYPDGYWSESARTAIRENCESELWHECEQDTTLAACMEYRKYFPDGEHIADVDSIYNARIAAKEKAVLDSIRRKKAEEEKRIAQEELIRKRHEEEVREDKRLWNSIRSSSDPDVFQRYLSSSGYRDPENEKAAKFMLSVSKARISYTAESYAESMKEYDKALSLKALTAEDAAKYEVAKEHCLYSDYAVSPSVSTAAEYLKEYPNGTFSEIVCNTICRKEADAMNYSTTLEDYNKVLPFARTKEDRDYLSARFKQARKDARTVARRSAGKEPFHLLIGVEGSAFFGSRTFSPDEYYVEEETSSWVYADMFSVTPLVSFGGHSNRFNVEAGYDFINNQILARPRLNIVRKDFEGFDPLNPKGSDYGFFGLYVAPEAFIRLDNTKEDNEFAVDQPRFSFAVRTGMSFSWFDVFAGYNFNTKLYYFGLGLYFGNK